MPTDVAECPNCRSGKRAWWMAPFAVVGAGLATMTLSACYGGACVATIKLPDGGTKHDDTSSSCSQYDCNVGEDGGMPLHDSQWDSLCK